MLPEFGREEVVELSGITRMPAFRIKGLRDQAILLDEVLGHPDLATVVKEVLVQELHDSVIERFVG